jgi:hypothetical protein
LQASKFSESAIDIVEIKLMANKQSPGEIAEHSGQFVPVDNKGKQQGVEVTVVKGKPLPPTPQPGLKWKPTDLTKNKSGRG